jgi:teichuronic acid biosynthesis glycosyltransferase TuaC
MKILTFSTLFPNAESPGHGIFVETRLRHLLNHFPATEAKVVAPVPWFPSVSKRFGSYAKFARVPRAETRHGIAVEHPRYPQIPKFGMTFAPYLLARASLPVLTKIIKAGFDFDLIDAHYYFPDGVAAAMLGAKLNKPVVVTARGSDINLIPEYATPRRMILAAARDVAASITVSGGLKSRLVNLGAEQEKIHVLRNGVDLNLFQPVDREKARAQLGWQANKVLLSVGNLLELKGHHLVIEALKDLPDYRLIIVGNGKEEKKLHDCCVRFSVTDRVEFVPSISQEKLKQYYGAADALILASSREGWANVLLESMACGTPVIATSVGGNPEVVAAPDAGVLLTERSASAIVSGVKTLFSRYPDRTATRRYAEQFDWAEISRMQMYLFDSILIKRKQNSTA